MIPRYYGCRLGRIVDICGEPPIIEVLWAWGTPRQYRAHVACRLLTIVPKHGNELYELLSDV